MERIYDIEENGSYGTKKVSYIFERIYDTEENLKKEYLEKRKNQYGPQYYNDINIRYYGKSYVKDLKISDVKDEMRLKIVQFTEVTLCITPKSFKEEMIKSGFFKKPNKRYIVKEWDYNWISKDVKVYSTAIVREDAMINKVVIKE